MSKNKTNCHELIVMIGISFSGKSYYVDLNYLPEYQLISRQHIYKALMTSKIKDKNFIYACMDIIARSHMIKGLPIVVDESNLKIESLFLWKQIAREFDYSIKGIFIDTPIEVCIKRLKYALNGEKITEEMHKKLTIEYNHAEELRKILTMKHQSVVDQIDFITYDGG